MAKSKKTILTEDTFNSNGNAVVTQDALNESIPVETNDQTEEPEVQSNDDIVNNDNINEDSIDESQTNEIDDTNVESDTNEEDTITPNDEELQDPQPETPVTPVVEDEDNGFETIGFESCHDDLYYTGKLV